MAEFGWIYLSRVALAKAQAQLTAESQGVRDEIGFLLIHQYYADRFFPGTSVLHTRLRYVLFVPWIYQLLSEGRAKPDSEQAVRKMEGDLCRRLLNHQPNQVGIIGRLSGGERMAQPPSMVYWNALVTWELVRREGGKAPSRRRVAQLAGKGHPRISRDLEFDEPPAVLPLDPFLPPRPNLSADSLSFALLCPERKYLCSKLRDLPSERQGDKPSVLAQLVRQIEASKKRPAFLVAENCWDSSVLALAEEERECLVRAGHAAAMAAIGRGVYAALVERLREQDDGSDVGELHRTALLEAVGRHRERALQLDIPRLAADAHAVPQATLEVLRKTQEWLKQPTSDVTRLQEVYKKAEWGRKRERSRLLDTLNGRKRRSDWKIENGGGNGDERTQADPLHYRWGIVRQLLSDLHGEPDGL